MAYHDYGLYGTAEINFFATEPTTPPKSNTTSITVRSNIKLTEEFDSPTWFCKSQAIFDDAKVAPRQDGHIVRVDYVGSEDEESCPMPMVTRVWMCHGNTSDPTSTLNKYKQARKCALELENFGSLL
jgi:hypothetical protein